MGDDLNSFNSAVEVSCTQVGKTQQQPVAAVCPQGRFMARLDACFEQALFKLVSVAWRVKTHRKVCAVAGCEFGAVNQRNQSLVEYFAPLCQPTVDGAR